MTSTGPLHGAVMRIVHDVPTPPRSPGTSGRGLATLAALATVLIAAFVVAPPLLAANGSSRDLSDEQHLREAFRSAFIEYWRSGDRDFPQSLVRVVDFWFRYHIAKAAIAALLLIVLVALGARLYRAFLTAGGPKAGARAAVASAGVLVTTLAVLSLMTVMANVQGVVAPFASLMPMLQGGPADPELTGTLAQLHQVLADSQRSGGPTPPPLDVMVGDYTRYHVAMVVIAAIVAVVLIGLSVVSVVSWKRFAAAASSDRWARRVPLFFGALSVLLALATILVGVANTTTVVNPAPGFLALLEGGW